MNSTEKPKQLTLTSTTPACLTKVSSFRADLIKDNTQFLNDQINKMKQLQLKLQNILHQVQTNKTTCSQTITYLNQQISDLDKKIAVYQTAINSNPDHNFYSQIKQHNHELKNIYDDRIRISKQLNIKHLLKLQIQDKKSIANDLFKWIMISIYNEPENKYFWPNFKEEALENDKGKDMIERLGRINANKQQHKLKTENFLNDFQNIKACSDFKNYQQQVEKIHQIAELYKKCYTINSTIKDTQKSIQKQKQTAIQKDEEFMRWKAKSQALKDRIKINQSYLQVLINTEKKINPKINIYNEKIKSGITLKNQMENIDQNIDQNIPQWVPSVKLGQERKNSCECIVF